MGARAGVTAKPQPPSIRWISSFVLVVAALCLFLAESASWISQTIFNQRSFTSISTGVLLSEQSRDSLATVIVDTSLQDKPTLNHLIGNNLKSLVSGLLGTDFASGSLTQLVSKSYGYLTLPNREDIAIDLTGLKRPLSTIVSTLEENGRSVQLDPSQIPSEITLVDSSSFPDLSSYIRGALVANILLWLLAIASFVLYVVIHRKHHLVKALYTTIAVIAVVALIGLMTGPFIPPIIATFISAIPIRSIATDLAEAFLQPFYAQLLLTLLVAGIVALGIRLRVPLGSAITAFKKRLHIDKS